MKKTPIRISSTYLRPVYEVESFKNIIDKSYKSILKFRKRHSFEAIAFTGTSGAALAYPLSYKLKVPLICVRKSIRDNHYKDKLEGATFVNSYIIVDDCIDSGRTVRNILKNIKINNPSAICKGIYLYNDFDPYLGSFESIKIFK